MKAETILHLEDTTSYADMIRDKDWLTSSETKNYIKEHLLFLKRIITFGKQTGYRELYSASDQEYLGIQCVRSSTAGGQVARFYNKNNLEDADKLLAESEGYTRT